MTGRDGASPPAGRREIFSWMLFDFANSSYTTVIVTVGYSVYFSDTVVVGDAGSFLWGLANFVSEILVVVSAPVVGACADFSAAKKRLLFVAYLGCVAGTAALGLVGPGDVVLGMALFVGSNVLFSSGENLIAAFLPEITTADRMGRVSGYGWAIGYAGGLLSLVACFPLLGRYFEHGDSGAMRWAFVIVSAFFLAGGAPTFLFLRERARRKTLPEGETYVSVGFRRVLETLRRVRHYRQLFRFLLVFLVYNCGVAIVVRFASIYAKNEIGMSGGELVVFFIVVQVSAAIGAFAFGLLQDRTSARTAIILALLLWLGVCAGAFMTRSATAFYAVGNLAGIAMGAAQSGARALVGTFSPPARTGEFFGFWGLFWKLSSGIGPLVYGAVAGTAGARPAILVTGLFFAAGIVGMLAIDEREGRRAAAAPPGGEARVGSPPRRGVSSE